MANLRVLSTIHVVHDGSITKYIRIVPYAKISIVELIETYMEEYIDLN